MKTTQSRNRLFTPENVEKNILWIMTAVGFSEVAILTWILRTELVLKMFFFLVWLVILAMVARKGMKYKIGLTGIAVEGEETTTKKEEGA